MEGKIVVTRGSGSLDKGGPPSHANLHHGLFFVAQVFVQGHQVSNPQILVGVQGGNKENPLAWMGQTLPSKMPRRIGIQRCGEF